MSDITEEHELAMTPDTLVALIPCPWPMIDAAALDEIHGEHWQEEVNFTLWPLDEAGREATGGASHAGKVSFTSGEVLEVDLLVEPPLPGMEQSAVTSVDPLAPAEILMLRDHQSVWRLSAPAGKRLGRRAAKRLSQLMATFIEAGACAVFLPGLVRLHSARFIRTQTMDLFDPQLLTNLFVSAWHEQEWMRTRGLTAFALPELEVSTSRGLNAAYFDLMDVAANMLMQMAQFPPDAELQLGHRRATLAQGEPRIAEDRQVPTNGHFGVRQILFNR